MALWNIKDLALPPIATYKGNTKDIDVCYLRQVCIDAIQFYEDKSYMHVEYMILSRIVYRMKQKFRSAKDFKAVVKVYKTLDNYFKLNMSACINTFIDLIPRNYTEESTYLPTKNLIDYVLVRHQGLVKLLVRVVETSKLAAHLIEERIHIGHSWQGAFILFAIVSRIYVLSKFIIQRACDFYQKLLPFSSKLKNLGPDWLKINYQLPKDLRQWLNVEWLDVDDDVKIIEELEMPRIIDFFDLVDDDDDVQFCDEYILLDESLPNMRDKGKEMLQDTIKTLRGFDLEDEGEIIQINSTIPNNSAHCVDFVKIIEKDPTIVSIGNTHLRDDKSHHHHADDNVDSSLAFGNISAIPNDTTLTENNLDRLNSTSISPDEDNIAQGIHTDDLSLDQFKRDYSKNNRNVCKNSLSNSKMKSMTYLEHKQNSRAHIMTNDILPSKSTTMDNSVEIIEKDVTIISVNDTICIQNNLLINDHDDDDRNITAIPLDTTITEKNVDCLYPVQSKNKKNPGDTPPYFSKSMRPFPCMKTKKQTEVTVSNSNENILPSTSKMGMKNAETKKPKHTDTTGSVPMRQLGNSTDDNIKEQELTPSSKNTRKTSNFTYSDNSDFNVTIPTGYVVLSTDSEDSDITITQSSIFEQKGKGQSKLRLQNHYTDSQDSWFIDIGGQTINEPYQINEYFTEQPKCSPNGYALSRRNKKLRKKKRHGDPFSLANAPKRARFDRDPQADSQTDQKMTPPNNVPHFKLKHKRKRKANKKRYYTMKLAE